MIFQFEDFLLDERSGALLLGDQSVEISRRASLLLFYLVRNRDRTVPKEELVGVLWDGSSVSESSLPRCMNELRSAIGNRDRDASGVIETVYGVGYRFVAEVEVIGASKTGELSSRSIRSLREDRIAVLVREIDVSRLDPKREAERLVELGILETKQGLFSDARVHLLRAAALARECGDGSLFAGMALAMSRTNMAIHINELFVELLREAIRMISPGPSPLLIELRAELGVAGVAFLSLSERQEVVRENLRDCKEFGETDFFVRVLLMSHRSLEGPGTLPERIDLAERALEIASELGQPELEISAEHACLANALCMGDRAQYEAGVERMSVLADVLEESIWHARVGLARSVVAVFGGQYDLAIQHRDHALSFLEQSPEDHVMAHYVNCFMLARERSDQMNLAMPGLAIDVGRDPLTAIATVLGLLYMGFREQAETSIHQLSVDWPGDLRHNLTWITAIALFAEASFMLDDETSARRIYDELSRNGEAIVVSMDANSCIEPIDYFRGLAATALEAWGDAQRHFESALTQSQKMRAPGFEARVSYAWAVMLWRQDGRGNLELVRQKVSFASEVAERLGMTRLEGDSAALIAEI